MAATQAYGCWTAGIRGRSVIAPVRGAVLEQAVAVIGFWAVAPADVGLVHAPVRQHRLAVGAPLSAPCDVRDGCGFLFLGAVVRGGIVTGAGVSQRNLRGSAL
jgi:hypothetical protein